MLLTILLLTIGHLVFSIGELKEKNDDNDDDKNNFSKKNYSISIIKMVMYALTKLVLFALLINLLMFTFYEKELISNVLAEILLYFISFQIFVESISLNHVMRSVVKSLNKFFNGEITLKEYFEKIMPRACKYAISGKEKILWISSLTMNCITILISIFLYFQDVNMKMFSQNIIIYFLIILYIKYQVLKLIKEVVDSKSN